MGNITNTNFDYTYDGKLSLDVFIKPAVQNPMIQSLFTIRQGINFKEQLNLLSPLGKVMKGSQGCGTPVRTVDAINFTNRTLEVCAWEAYAEQCHDTFQGTIIGEMLNNNIREPELIGTRVGSLIQQILNDAIQRDIFRVFSFGDTSSGDPYYNNCDGLWTRLIAGAASYDVSFIEAITSQAANDVKGYFKNLWEGAPIILKQIDESQKAFYTTGNMYESLMTYYENTANTGGFTQREENGKKVLQYRGIDIIPLYAWDNWIATDNLGNNSRILYTTKMNHIIGVQEANTMGNTRVWFDPDTNLNKYRARFKMGYNYVHGELQAYSIGNV